MNQDKEQSAVINIGQIDIDSKAASQPADMDALMVLPTRNLVLFPGVTIPISIGREKSLEVANFSQDHRVPICVVCQKDASVENPSLIDLYEYGVVADVLKVFELPDGQRTAIVRAREKVMIDGLSEAEAPEGIIVVCAHHARESEPRKDIAEYQALTEAVKETALRIVSKTTDGAQSKMMFGFDSSVPQKMIINVIATQMPIDVQDKMSLLELSRLKERAKALLGMLVRDEEKADMAQLVMERARRTIEQNQKNVFLQQQMDAIREELYGEPSDEIDVLVQRGESVIFPENVRKTFDKEIEKLRHYNPQSPDYSVQYTYIDTLLSLPWGKYSELNTDFAKTEDILEADHYGLEKVKERILEQLALLMDNPDNLATIICLVGPPGVGKTSLGKSVARALGREYGRVSLGGLHDEAEIRGHRRTYIGAMPGRIIDAMKRVGTSNPVILLDELDKIGSDFKGDPAAALLEVLDPAQNCHFHDNYVDVDFDLSKVLFIATANTLSTISRPLLDRIEVIDISGYIVEEKIEIARRHFIPQLISNFPSASDLNISDEALTAIIENYTSESGVRQLEKRLAAVVRKRVLAAKKGAEFPNPVKVEHLKDILGTVPHIRERYDGNEFAGVVTGLAWTEVGGEILLVETSLSDGKGEKLTLTGNLGTVMKESAQIALQWVKAHSKQIGIDDEMLNKDVHIHFPEGAIPKDGPSAGITMATSLVSAFTGRKVRERIAMTGEMTLRGKVLPVGGIKEKILAAKRAGITDIVLSAENRKDIEDIQKKYVDGVTFHYVDTIADVLEYALLDEQGIR